MSEVECRDVTETKSEQFESLAQLVYRMAQKEKPDILLVTNIFKESKAKLNIGCQLFKMHFLKWEFKSIRFFPVIFFNNKSVKLSVFDFFVPIF